MNSWDFTSSRLKVKRAIRHIEEIQANVTDFLKTDFYTISIEKQDDTGKDFVKLHMTKPFPNEIALVIGDAVHNLRSALDHIAVEIARHTTGINSLKHIYFPFRKTREDLVAAFENGEIAWSTEKIRWLILEVIQPYESGNLSLYAISKMDTFDKHRLLIPTVAVTELSGVVIECDEDVRLIRSTGSSGNSGGLTNVIGSVDDNVFTCDMRVGSTGAITTCTTNAGNMKIKSYGEPAFDIFFDVIDEMYLPRRGVNDLLSHCANAVTNYIDAFDAISTNKI